MISSRIQRLIGWAWFTSLRRRLLVLGALAVLIAAAAILHRPVLHHLRAWRASRLVAEAQSHAAKGNWESVERTARSSLQLVNSIDALRLLLHAQREFGSPERLRLAALLFQHPEATLEDRAALIAMALDERDLLLAAKWFGALGPTVHSVPELHFQKVRYHLAMREAQLALALADAMHATPAQRAGLDLLLASGLAKSGQIERRPEVTRRLTSALQLPGPDAALAVLRALVALPDKWISSALASQVISRLASEDTLPEQDVLAVALLRAGLPGENRHEIIAQTIATFQHSDLPALCGWLSRLREWDRLVDLTEPSMHPGGLDLASFGFRADALGALHQLEDLDRELRSAPARFPQPLLLASRAAVADLLGKESEAVLLWQQAFQLAKRDHGTNYFYDLARIAGQAGARDTEMNALASGIEHPLGTPPTADRLDALFAWLYQQGETERLLSLSAELLKRESGNPILINNFHYLQALHGQPREDSLASLETLVRTFPQKLSFRGTLAFVKLRTGDPAGALTVLEGLQGAPATLHAPEMATYCAALHALNRPTEAEPLEEGIDWTQLPAPERTILRALLDPSPNPK